jgi:hypothetical protein
MVKTGTARPLRQAPYQGITLYHPYPSSGQPTEPARPPVGAPALALTAVTLMYAGSVVRPGRGLMRSQWPWWGKKAPKANIWTGGILFAFGLWDLFFVLFRSEDALFTASAALLLLVGSFDIWLGVTRLRTQKPGNWPDPGKDLTR